MLKILSADSLTEKSNVKRFLLWTVWLLVPAVILFFPFESAAQDQPIVSELTNRLNSNFQNLSAVKAYVELELSQGSPSQGTTPDQIRQKPQQSSGQIAYDRLSDSLYFKTFTPLTPHFFTLISKKETFWLQIPKAKVIYTGPLSAIGAEHFEMKISPQDLKELLIPTQIKQDTEDIRLSEQPSAWILEIYQKSQNFKTREIWMDKQSQETLKDVRFSSNGTPFLIIFWDQFQMTAGGGPFPRSITLAKPLINYELRLRLKKLQLVASLPEGLFELRSKEGFEIETIHA